VLLIEPHRNYSIFNHICFVLAEGVRFELTRERNPLPVFKTGALNHSATLPDFDLTKVFSAQDSSRGALLGNCYRFVSRAVPFARPSAPRPPSRLPRPASRACSFGLLILSLRLVPRRKVRSLSCELRPIIRPFEPNQFAAFVFADLGQSPTRFSFLTTLSCFIGHAGTLRPPALFGTVRNNCSPRNLLGHIR
jgi:hypothetical protein